MLVASGKTVRIFGGANGKATGNILEEYNGEPTTRRRDGFCLKANQYKTFYPHPYRKHPYLSVPWNSSLH